MPSPPDVDSEPNEERNMWSNEKQSWYARTTGVNEREWPEKGEWKNPDRTHAEEVPSDVVGDGDEGRQNQTWEPEADSPLEYQNWSKMNEPIALEREN
jgi:hypothetical protein